MKLTIQSRISGLLVFGFLLLAQSGLAQIKTDLELQVAYPHNHQVIPFGDTVNMRFYIINHGPNPIVDDTLLIKAINSPYGIGFVGDIPVGDTGIARGIIQWADTSQTKNDTINTCFYFRDPVSYSGRVIDTNSLNDTTCITYVMLGRPTGVKNISKKRQIKVFPNPAKNELYIAFSNGLSPQAVSFDLVNVLGQSVLRKTLSIKGKEYIKLDLNTIPSGLYFLKIRGKDGQETRKVFVQH